MVKTELLKKEAVLGIILLFIFGCCMPGLNGTSIMKKSQQVSLTPGVETQVEKTLVTCVAFGTTRNMKQQVTLTQQDASMILEQLRELKTAMTQHPYSEKTKTMRQAFVDLLAEKNLIPQGTSNETYLSLLSPRWIERIQHSGNPLLSQPFTNHGTSTFCSIGGEGSGVLIPLFMLPRPRIAMLWLGNGETLAANLLTSRGYVAEGLQAGFTVGFMGIGISYAIPGASLYGFIGYAILASTTAENIAHYPPNSPPVVSAVSPADGEKYSPKSLSELQFRIQDADGDLMSYTVTTTPDIGSGSGNLKPFGVYSVPVSGLQSSTTYTWHVEVTDGKDTTADDFTFTTAPDEPVLSDISPQDGTQDVSSGLNQIRFTVTDYQGDAMDYTVQTSPDIGSAQASGIHNGTYTVALHGVANGTLYQWYVNVTDGTHWTRKIFTFETAFPSVFDPFDYGWQYRKQITVLHTQVAEDLTEFPLLIEMNDADLQKAQANGNDLLFMNGVGNAGKIFHEIEAFDAPTGHLTVWVNVPFISSSTDTALYLYYGNARCGNQQRQKATWDPQYIGVWHFNQESGLVLDSIRQHNGTATSGVTEGISGLIDGAFGFDGATGYVDFGDINRNVYDFSFWVKPTNTITPSTPNTGILHLCRNGIISIGVSFGAASDLVQDETILLCSSPPELRTAVTGLTISNTMFHLITFNWNSAANRYDIYYDGAPQPVTCGTSSGFLPVVNLVDFGVGHDYSGSSGLFYNGLVDEVRLVGSSHTSGWISTEYNNQINPSSFVSIGPEVPHP